MSLDRPGKSSAFLKKSSKKLLLILVEVVLLSLPQVWIHRSFCAAFFKKRLLPREDLSPPRQAGFTLIEIMVALVVFGFLMIGLTQGIHFGLRAWNDQAQTIAKRGDLDATDRTLRTLIARMDPGFRIDPPNIIGLPHGLAFTTQLPRGAPGDTFRHADVSLTVDRRHDLILRWTPHWHATRVSGVPVIAATTLLHGVARVDFAYWRTTKAGGAWLSTWNSRTPPALVRITIVFADNRHWPAIVIAPMRRPVQ